MDHHDIARALTNATSEESGHNTTSSSTSSKAKTVKRIDYVRTQTAFWHWYIVAGIIAALTLVNLFRLALAYTQRRRSIHAKEGGGDAVTDVRGGVGRMWSAMEVMRTNALYVGSFPVALYKGTNVSEVFFSLAYLGVCLGLTLYKTYRESVILIKCGQN